MYRLAICEDELHIRDELCRMCHHALTQQGVEHEVVPFSCAEELEQTLHAPGQEPFDLLLLDIKLGGKTGLELARELREQDDRVSIIFVSSCTEHLSDGYEVQPVHFLLKPVGEAALADALRTDLRVNHSPRHVLLRSRSETLSLPIREIRAIESSDHAVLIHTTQGERTFPLLLSQAERMLPPGQFCRCHRCYLINIAHVETIGRTEVVMRGGQTIPVGRKYTQTVQDFFVRYINQS